MEIITTKEQRHEIYKEALAWLESDVIAPYSMCACIYNVLQRMYHMDDELRTTFFNLVIYSNTFPEFEALRPPSITKKINLYWWDKDDKEIRIKNFKLLIEQTK